jgi:hypothetical protein
MTPAAELYAAFLGSLTVLVALGLVVTLFVQVARARRGRR